MTCWESDAEASPNDSLEENVPPQAAQPHFKDNSVKSIFVVGIFHKVIKKWVLRGTNRS